MNKIVDAPMTPANTPKSSEKQSTKKEAVGAKVNDLQSGSSKIEAAAASVGTQSEKKKKKQQKKNNKSRRQSA